MCVYECVSEIYKESLCFCMHASLCLFLSRHRKYVEVTVTSPVGLWTTVMEPQVWHFGVSKLDERAVHP